MNILLKFNMNDHFPVSRKNTESLINERVSILKQSNTIEEAEKKIGMGQIEEVE